MTDSPHADAPSIGQNVRAIRRSRGISQEVLAGLAGLSRGAIAKYESGERPIDSRRTLLALAAALDVTVGDLTGHEQEKFAPSTVEFHRVVPELEAVLWARGNLTDTRPAATLDELAGAVVVATRLRADCDYTALAPMLVPMLTDAYRHLRDTPTTQAWDVFAAVTYGIASALRARGYHALAWIAVQESERAAGHLGPAAIAAAAFGQGQIMLSHPGALQAALANSTNVAARVGAELRTVGEIETYGMLHLHASLIATTLGGDPAPYLAEAGEAVARLERAQPSTSLARNESFGAANVALWRMSSAMEVREPGQVLDLAGTLTPDDLPNHGRRAQYFVEIGRAHAAHHDHQQALYALLRAEHIAPQHVRSMPVVRELTGHMMRTARKNLTTGELGRFAQRIGVVPQ